MKTLEKIKKCLESLVNVDDWDACPFCGRNQRPEGIKMRNHDEDCPVELAREILDA